MVEIESGNVPHIWRWDSIDWSCMRQEFTFGWGQDSSSSRMRRWLSVWIGLNFGSFLLATYKYKRYSKAVIERPPEYGLSLNSTDLHFWYFYLCVNCQVDNMLTYKYKRHSRGLSATLVCLSCFLDADILLGLEIPGDHHSWLGLCKKRQEVKMTRLKTSKVLWIWKLTSSRLLTSWWYTPLRPSPQPWKNLLFTFVDAANCYVHLNQRVVGGVVVLPGEKIHSNEIANGKWRIRGITAY